MSSGPPEISAAIRFPEALYQLIVAVDIAGFTDQRRSSVDQLTMHGSLTELVERAFNEADIEWDSCAAEDRGDGKLILVPPTVPRIRLADQLWGRLLAGLRRHNAMYSDNASMRLRVALHAGDVRASSDGMVGTAINFSCRILDAPVAKEALVRSNSMLALIASKSFFHDVIAPDPAAEPELFQQIPVEVKTTSDTAWLRLSNQAEAYRVAAQLADQELTGVRTALVGTDAWGDIPPRNPIFTGREEVLAELDRQLTPGNAAAILPAALYGMGGIGKTQIAVEYVYRHAQDFDLVWWVQATHLSQLRASLTELAQALELPGSSDASTAVPAVREALRRGHPVRRWLLVFDAAESPDDVRPFFPNNGPGKILVTSRNPDWAENVSSLGVDLFEREESKRLLRRRGPDITEDEADALADKLGDLPLAIAQAAAWRAETGMSVTEYLRVFDEKVAEILDSSTPHTYEVSLAAAWNVSFNQLEKRNPAAHQLLQVCAFFGPQPISRSLFTGIRGTAISPELDAALRNPTLLGRAIRDINRYGLAKIDHRHDTLQLHRLVQAVLRDRMPPRRRVEMRHGAHLLLANLNPNDPGTPAQWSRYQAILPHAYASNVLDCDDPWVQQMVLDLMEYLYRWGDHEESAALARQAMNVWSEKLGETDPQRLQAATRLSYYLWTLGQYAEAATINQRTLALRRQTSGDNSEESLVAELHVATDLKAMGEFQAARDMNEQTYRKGKALFGADDPVTLQAAHDLASSLRLRGDYPKARRLSEDTYRRRAEILGFDSAPTISTLADLIGDRLELGDNAWAHSEAKRLADRSQQLFGEDKANTLRHYLLLSIAMRRNGDHREALEHSGWALDRSRQRYGHDHPQTLRCAIAHSIDLRHNGDLQAARVLGEDTFERYGIGLGENHPHTLSAALDLAVTLRLSGEITRAQRLDDRCVDQFRALFGPNQIHTIIATINHASDFAALGEIETALTLGTEVPHRAERLLGVDHPTTLAASHNLVLDLRAAGRGDEAEAAHADVVARYCRVLGDTHPAAQAATRYVRANCDIDPSGL